MKAVLLGIQVLHGALEIYIIIGLGTCFLGIIPKLSVKKSLISYFIIGIFINLLRTIQPFPYFHTIIILVILIIFVNRAYGVTLPRSILVVLLGITTLAMVESFSILVITKISGLPLAQICADPWLRIKYTLPHLAILCSFIYFLRSQNNWYHSLCSRETVTDGEKGEGLSTLAPTLSNFMLFQMVLLAIINILLNLVISERIHYSIPQTLLLGINIFLTASSILALLVYRKLFNLSEQELMLQTQKALLQNVNELFNTIKVQRHDFVNQLQTVYGYLVLGNVDECRLYVSSLVEETASFSELLSVNHPGLCALLLSKAAAAERKNILLEIESNVNLLDVKVKPHHLNAMLGNLIDNAFEAVLAEPPEERLVWVKISGDTNNITFLVINKGPIIPSEMVTKIFDPGFTTKSRSEHMGMGLYSVKTLVNKYNGQLRVKSKATEGTVFTIILPHKTKGVRR